MPITTSMGGFYNDEMEWHRDQVFPKSADPQMNIDADQFLNERMGTDEEKAPLDLGLPPEDQTNPLNDVVSSNPQPTQVGAKEIPSTSRLDKNEEKEKWLSMRPRNGRSSDDMQKLEPDLEMYHYEDDPNMIFYYKKTPPKEEVDPKNLTSSIPQPTLVAGKDIKPIQIPVRGNPSLQRAIENAEGDDDLRDLMNRLQKRGINTDAIPAFKDLK